MNPPLVLVAITADTRRKYRRSMPLGPVSKDSKCEHPNNMLVWVIYTKYATTQ